LSPQEVWQELSVRDQLQPGESEPWIVVWVEILEQVRHAEQNRKLSLLVETV